MLLVFSCGETQNIGNKLSADEIEYLRSRAARKCIADTNGDYLDFISTSSGNISDYERDANQWTFKASNDSATTHDIFVWKRTSSAIYFRIRLTQASGDSKNIFLKWSLTSNSDLMKSVQEDECAQGDYEGTSSASSVTLRKDDASYSTYDADTNYRYKIFRTFKYTSSIPAVFGLLSYTTNKQFYDTKGNTVSTPAAVKVTYTIASASATTQTSDTHTDYTNRVYCLVDSDERGTRTYRRYSSIFTDILQAGNSGANLECETGDGDTVTVGVANQETFVPATELINPDSH